MVLSSIIKKIIIIITIDPSAVKWNVSECVAQYIGQL